MTIAAINSRLFDAGMAFLPIVEEMQTSGMPVYRPHFEQLYRDATDEARVIQARISHLYNNDRPINPNSSKQVAALCARLGIRGLKFTASGEMSTDKKSLQYLRAKHPAISDVFDYREVAHVRDAFVVPVLEACARDTTGSDYVFIHPVLKSTRTTSRRLAAGDPNLLAFPTRTAVGRRVRAGFRCPPGLTFGGWDLSQIEMRFGAHESGDRFLCELFSASDRDVHYETAARIFQLPVDLSIPDARARYAHIDKNLQRSPAKNAGFGIFYGISASGLLVQLQMLGIEGWTEETCQTTLIDGWLDTFPGVRDYIARKSAECARVGYSQDFMGHTRPLPAFYSGNRALVAEAGRQAVNHVIQSGAQSMIQNSMIWLAPKIRAMQERGADVRWALQIHDEIILIFTPDLWDELNDLVTEALTQHSGITLRVPVLCEGHCAETWGELK